MRILGLSALADASAAIVRDQGIVCAVEEERLNRQKHYEGMPWLAIQECLRTADMSLDELDGIAVGWNPCLGWPARLSETARSFFRMPRAFVSKVGRGGNYLGRCREMFSMRWSLRRRFPGSAVRQRILFVQHHLAHAASSFLTSPYDEADIIVADGVGERATISLFVGRGSEIDLIQQLNLPHSLGHLYAAVTGFLGFKMTCDEGKTMALAAFGQDSYRDLFSRLVRIDEHRGRIFVDPSVLDYHAARNGVFSRRWLKLTGLAPRRKDEPLAARHQDLSCSLQKRVEEVVLWLLRAHFGERPKRPLCAAGGLFLNSVMNGEIVRRYNPQLFVHPAAGDSGVSVGAGLYAGTRLGKGAVRCPIIHAYFAREPDEGEIQSAFRAHSLSPRRSSDVFAEASEEIAQGRVVAWYQGRMEFGPRALGNRSILADPTSPTIKDQLNLKVKHREPFRPFAGTVILEEAPEYFEHVVEAPFMLKVFFLKEKYWPIFPALRHVDNSCRIQTLREEQNPVLYRLLLALRKRNGYGMVLNTSMNVAGEPIINTPDEALVLIEKTDVDVLVVGDYIIRKDEVFGGRESPNPLR
ncbi:MAG: hypothetical protein NTW96_25715 [Planctomycetia bacterium]|nr:hypothetical protein [Planctomycetia bacterium]